MTDIEEMLREANEQVSTDNLDCNGLDQRQNLAKLVVVNIADILRTEHGVEFTIAPSLRDSVRKMVAAFRDVVDAALRNVGLGRIAGKDVAAWHRLPHRSSFAEFGGFVADALVYEVLPCKERFSCREQDSEGLEGFFQVAAFETVFSIYARNLIDELGIDKPYVDVGDERMSLGRFLVERRAAELDRFVNMLRDTHAFT